MLDANKLDHKLNQSKWFFKESYFRQRKCEWLIVKQMNMMKSFRTLVVGEQLLLTTQDPGLNLAIIIFQRKLFTENCKEKTRIKKETGTGPLKKLLPLFKEIFKNFQKNSSLLVFFALIP